MLGSLLLALGCGGSEAPPAAQAPAPTEAPSRERVFFVSPQDGATLTSPFAVEFGAENLVVEKAGQVRKGHGHHHLIINGSVIETGKMVPKDEQHIHYGDGQTETEVSLEPGSYSLTLQFADGNHMSYGPAGATTIRITVE